jgi:hypothetical protein
MISSHKEPIVIGSNEFRTKTEAKAFYRSMRARYSVNERVQAADAKHLAALLDRHPERVQKVGVGVAHFIAILAYRKGTACFAVVRTDGSKEDFSYLACVDKKVRSH